MLPHQQAGDAHFRRSSAGLLACRAGCDAVEAVQRLAGKYQTAPSAADEARNGNATFCRPPGACAPPAASPASARVRHASHQSASHRPAPVHVCAGKLTGGSRTKCLGPRFTARPPDSPLDSPPRPLATAGLCAASAALRSTCVAASPWCRVRLRQLARERATKRPCRLTPLATLRRNRWSWSSLSGRSSSGRRSRSLRPSRRPPARSASRRVARVLLCARHRPVRRCGRHRHSPRGLTPSTKLPAARPLVSGCPALTRLPDAPHAPHCSGCRCRGAAVVCAGAAARVLGGQIVRAAL